MTYRLDGLRSTEQQIKKLEKEMTDAYWDGNDSYGDDLRASLETYYEMRKRGELYDPAF